jgi:KaiC/GvpD/RAD55 family RecA-like ATPase
MRVSSGIMNLDEKIDGGIPPVSSVLLVGSPGSGKTTFCNQFAYWGIEKDESVIYIVFSERPKDVKDHMKKFGWNLEGKIVIFIDVYSWQAGGDEKGRYSINNPADLNEFNIKISEAINELQDKNLKRCCVDALSTLFLYIPSDLAIRFSSLLFAKLKAANITTLTVLEKDVLDTKTLAMLSSFTDGMIELGFDPTNKNQRLMRIERMKDTKPISKWMKFDITEKGIIVKG